jgi:hypothetical protein
MVASMGTRRVVVVTCYIGSWLEYSQRNNGDGVKHRAGTIVISSELGRDLEEKAQSPLPQVLENAQNEDRMELPTRP